MRDLLVRRAARREIRYTGLGGGERSNAGARGSARPVTERTEFLASCFNNASTPAAVGKLECPGKVTLGFASFSPSS